MKKLYFATNNAHKLEEARAILQDVVEVLSLNDLIAAYPGNPHADELSDIPETADTLAGNSLQKAQYVYERYGVDCFADDTGLEIEALDGAPGVYTARWSGGGSLENCQKAIRELSGKEDRRARFHTVITLCKDGKMHQVEGIVNGQIAQEMYGNGGFGYDPVFVPEGHTTTFAEMPAEAKNGMSHRGRALEAMRKLLGIFAFLFGFVSLIIAQDTTLYNLEMGQFALHYAYGQVSHIAMTPQEVYALSEGALFSVNRQTEEITYHNRLTGLNGNTIAQIAYDNKTRKLLIFYRNGLVDLLTDKGVENIPDLYNKQMNFSKAPLCVYVHEGMAYMGMAFGILVVNMQKVELADTYYIGDKGKEMPITALVIRDNYLYARNDNGQVYRALLTANLVDYNQWQIISMTTDDQRALFTYQDTYASSHGEEWIAAGEKGLERRKDGSTQYFIPNGPAVNIPYRMKFAGNRLYVVPGGRWASQYWRKGYVMMYEDGFWRNLLYDDIQAQLSDGWPLTDLVNIAVDPNDDNHFFATSYGNGLIEFRDNRAVRRYSELNSPLRSASYSVPTDYMYYTRTEGAVYDQEGNLWVMNAGGSVNYNVHILTPAGKWYSMNVITPSGRVTYKSPGEILIDRRQPNIKYIPYFRDNTGVAILDDHGTPTDSGDDKAVFRTSWTDQNARSVSPSSIYCMAQDLFGNLWIGSDLGPFYLPATVDPFTSSTCARIVIDRTDGSNLADYLLENEIINAIAIDGGNRKWFGTANSGAFLMSEDCKETILHLTNTNSPLPSNNVLSIAIHPVTGEVFIGTEEGLMSYQSDASTAAEDYSSVSVFPNPVRPDWDGVVTVTGLMLESEVHITNAAGETICRLSSNGGTAVWNLCTMAGKRVSPGVYLIFCNGEEGAHCMQKVLVM